MISTGSINKEDLQPKLLQYNITKPITTSVELDIQCNFKWDTSPLGLEIQFDLLGCIPNFHRWQLRRESGLKKEQYFVNNGRSPRNQIISSLTQSHTDSNAVCAAILLQVIENKFALPVFEHTSEHTAKKIRRKISERKPVISKTDLCAALDITVSSPDTEPVIGKGIFYSTYCKELLERGQFLWRLSSSTKNVVVMNDYSVETGDFKVIHYYYLLKIDIDFKTETNFLAFFVIGDV